MVKKAPISVMQKLDAIRYRRGITIKTWAELAGVSRMTIYRALNKDKSVSLETGYRLATALAINLGTDVPLD